MKYDFVHSSCTVVIKLRDLSDSNSVHLFTVSLIEYVPIHSF